VVEVVRPVDKMKNNEPKTFCFVTFAREDSAKQLVKAVRIGELISGNDLSVFRIHEFFCYPDPLVPEVRIGIFVS
jgi:hypothetical protein